MEFEFSKIVFFPLFLALPPAAPGGGGEGLYMSCVGAICLDVRMCGCVVGSMEVLMLIVLEFYIDLFEMV